MVSNKTLIFGQDKVWDKFCNICGLSVYEGDGGCKRYHKTKNPKRGRFSGKSKSNNAFGDYKD